MRTFAIRLLALLLVAVIFPFTGAGRLAAAAARRFSLAVLRRDGVLLPFADYARGRWSSYWPKPAADREVPLSLANVPKGWWPDRKPITAWMAWPVDGPSRLVHVSGPVWVAAHCLANVGLKSDYRSAESPPPPEVTPYPKDGLATSGDVTIEPVEVLNQSSPDWTKIATEVAGLVTRSETDSVRRFGSEWTHPVDVPGRSATPLQLEVLCRSLTTGAPTTFFYFEGTKHYKNPKDVGPRPCDIITFATGWVSRDPGGKMNGVVNAFITDCRMEAMLYRLPLGQIRLEGKLFWVVQVSGWQYERYDILEINETRVRTTFTTPGGGCGR
jgi:hypothetical protein